MNLRSPIPAVLVALTLASTAHADDPAAASSTLPGGVTFTPGPAPLGAVTFTPGPAPLGPVTFTPGRDPHEEAPHAVAPAPVAETPTTPSPFVVIADPPATPASAPVAASPAAHAVPVPGTTTAASAARLVTAPEVPAEPAGAYDCRAEGPVERVDLQAGGTLRAVQVALATRGGNAAALVTLARPGGPREGFVYPESRWVRIPAEGAPEVRRAPGFEPDATMALGADGSAFVVGYTRLDVRGGPDAAPSVRVAVLGGAGDVARTLPGSAGLKVDSAPVAFEGGYAVVLGRETQNADGSLGPVREWLYQFDARGELAREPRVIADGGSDDTMSRFRVGVGVVSGEGGREELVASWTSAQGANAGVWVRRVRGDEVLPTVRVASQPAWGAQVAGDGGGVLFRTESAGAGAAPIDLWFQRWDEGSAAQRVGAGWDPSLAFVRGRVLVSGVTLRGEAGDEVPALLGAALPGQSMRAVEFAGATGAAVERAVDSDLAATDHGAVLAWVESERAARGETASDAYEDPAPRRLALARVHCGR